MSNQYYVTIFILVHFRCDSVILPIFAEHRGVR